MGFMLPHMAVSLDMPSKHANGRRKMGVREALFRVVVGGNESGINCALEVSLYQLFIYLCSEHLCCTQSTYVPS